jgi:hypothetical protein
MKKIQEININNWVENKQEYNINNFFDGIFYKLK